jgi:hypothetical protein
MKERVSIRKTGPLHYVAVNKEAIGKERGEVFSIVLATLAGKPLVPARNEAPRRLRRD